MDIYIYTYIYIYILLIYWNFKAFWKTFVTPGEQAFLALVIFSFRLSSSLIPGPMKLVFNAVQQEQRVRD